MSLSLGSGRGTRIGLLVAMVAFGTLASSPRAFAQFAVQQQVGGVSIDAQGVIARVTPDQAGDLRRARMQAFQPVPGDLKSMALRKISLRQLEAAIAEHRKNGTPLSDEMRYLAGLQRIQYVFVYPDEQDIVLAGPGEGWRIDPQGEVVGVTTNRPVMLLDDLLVALRARETLQRMAISCSIDPTAGGIARFQELFRTINTAPSDVEPLLAAIEQAMGPQTITVSGVPATSHFARVLVAADYRMKRMAMAFEPAPIAGLPNYLQMIKTTGRAPAALPRWWLAPDYAALVTDPQGLSWELPRSGVKAMSEDAFVTANGQKQVAAQSNPATTKWAANMTAHYDELSQKEPIFGQLRNLMDLAVLSALITRHNLTEKSGWSMPLLTSDELATETYNAPQSVATQASVLQKSGKTIISASGGVSINPWPILDSAAPSAALTETRSAAATRGSQWWWN